VAVADVSGRRRCYSVQPIATGESSRLKIKQLYVAAKVRTGDWRGAVPVSKPATVTAGVVLIFLRLPDLVVLRRVFFDWSAAGAWRPAQARWLSRSY